MQQQQQPPATQSNYFHGQSFAREGKTPSHSAPLFSSCFVPQRQDSHGGSFYRLVTNIVCAGQPMNETTPKPPAINSGPTPMFIDTPPPSSNRTTLPPIEAQFDPNVRRGSITDPSMHATSSTDIYRNSNGSTRGPTQSYQSYTSTNASRPHSLRDERPPTPDFSERKSIDSDSQHGGYNDRHHSFVSDHHTHPSLSRKSSASGWSRVNGNGTAETASLKAFDARLSHLHLDSTTSLGSTSTGTSNRHPNGANFSRAQQYLSDYDNPPHRRITPHLAPPISSTAPGTFAERYPQSKTYPYPHPNAPHPTPGYPYAFPDPTFENVREQPPPPPSSVSSSQADSTHTQSLHYQRSLPSIHPVHEQSIRDSDMQGIMSSAPYSRSPELRVSHKLAERKRRREMKDLFDELRDSLPVDKTLKTSKWEILSKGCPPPRLLFIPNCG